MEQEIVTRLAAVLSGGADFGAFSAWLADLELALTPATYPRSRKILYRIVGQLDTYDRGAMTDERLFAHLLALLPVPLARQVCAARRPTRPTDLTPLGGGQIAPETTSRTEIRSLVSRLGAVLTGATAGSRYATARA